MLRLRLAPILRLLALAAIVVAPPTAARAQEIATCDKSFGRLAVYEPGDVYLQALSRFQLPSPTPLLRLFAQKSGCFRVLERGVAFQAIERERQLAGQGQLQGGSNMGGGQMATADFVLAPSVQFSNQNAGGLGGLAGGLFSHAPIVGAVVAGKLKFKEAQTTITLADARTSEQVGVAEGKARKSDFSLGALGIAGAGVAGVGGYTNTAEGKVIAASFLDNFNKLVADLKANPEMQARLTAGGASAAAPKAGAVFAEGDVVGPKIDGVKLLAGPADNARVVSVLKRNEQMIASGEEKSGYVRVTHPNGDGWVRKAFVAKQ